MVQDTIRTASADNIIDKEGLELSLRNHSLTYARSRLTNRVLAELDSLIKMGGKHLYGNISDDIQLEANETITPRLTATQKVYALHFTYLCIDGGSLIYIYEVADATGSALFLGVERGEDGTLVRHSPPFDTLDEACSYYDDLYAGPLEGKGMTMDWSERGINEVRAV